MQSELSQAASAVMMIRPVRFTYNAQTAVDNVFQVDTTGLNDSDVQKKAQAEFDEYVRVLEKNGIEVACFEDTPEPHTPDSIFCNNWISFHDDGTVIQYPMKALNRRLERREDIVKGLADKYGFDIRNQVSITMEEHNDRFLEGTGSIIFDYINKIAYASVSQRTNVELLGDIARRLGYTAHPFHSVDANGVEYYHTNVVMCLAEKFVLICLESVKDDVERENLVHSFNKTEHTIVDLTFEQAAKYAANSLEVQNSRGKKFLIMSRVGVNSLREDQKEIIERSAEILPIDIDVIETIGGGSARCMIADIRLPKKL